MSARFVIEDNNATPKILAIPLVLSNEGGYKARPYKEWRELNDPGLRTRVIQFSNFPNPRLKSGSIRPSPLRGLRSATREAGLV